MNSQLCSFFSPTVAAWGQVVVGAVAAIATIWAVLAALRTSRDGLRAARQIAIDGEVSKSRAREEYAKTLAAAFVEELWENAVKAHTIHNMGSVFPEDEPLCRYLVYEQERIEAPLLEGSVGRLDAFELADAQLFARCATKIVQLRRTARSFERNLELRFFNRTVREIVEATSQAPQLLDEGLARAHALSGIPVTKRSPAEVGAVEGP